MEWTELERHVWTNGTSGVGEVGGRTDCVCGPWLFVGREPTATMRIQDEYQAKRGEKKKTHGTTVFDPPLNFLYSPFRFANIFSYILSALFTLPGSPTSTIFNDEAPDRFGAGELWKAL